MVAVLAAGAQASGQTDTKTKSTQKTTTTSSKKSVREDIKATDLPKAANDNIAQDYSGFTVKKATKVTLNNVVTYEVVVNKGTTNTTLVYDKDGKFVKKLAPKPTTKKKKR